MECGEIFVDAFGRIKQIVHSVVDGLTPEQLAVRIDPQANSIAWLVWHLTRVQDDHIADVAGHDQVWLAQGWVDRFNLPFDRHAIGYGHSSEEVAHVRADARLLSDYHDAVHDTTVGYVKGLGLDDLDRVVDTSWDPPVTLGVRLVSVLGDDFEHAGQAAFARGLIERRRG